MITNDQKPVPKRRNTTRSDRMAAMSDKSRVVKEKKIDDWLENERLPNYQKQYENEEYM